ncbi:MAG: hypothetical protein P1U57_11195, partial [Oleibacter sp.]|nr:hypothetical protein [Thalassolituus sp.]
GAAGYVYGNDTLVSTAHLGNKEDGLLLSLVDGTQRRYVNANADPAAEIQGFLDFIEILFPQTPPQ